MAKRLDVRLQFEMSLDDINEYNRLVDRDTAMLGKPSRNELPNVNLCPVCGNAFGFTDKFCCECGQRVKFNYNTGKKSADDESVGKVEEDAENAKYGEIRMLDDSIITFDNPEFDEFDKEK